MIAVSPSLEHFQVQNGRPTPPGTCKLLPSTYAWLHHQTSIAQEKYHVGQISASTWETIRSRFNDIHRMAVSSFGQSTLDTVLSMFSRMSPAERTKIDPFSHTANQSTATHDATAQDNTVSNPAGRVERQPDEFSSTSMSPSQATGNRPAASVPPMDPAETKAMLDDWEHHCEEFKKKRIEVEIATKHCGKIVLVPELTDRKDRKELLIHDAKPLIMLANVFGPGVEVVEFKDIRHKRERGGPGFAAHRQAKNRVSPHGSGMIGNENRKKTV